MLEWRWFGRFQTYSPEIKHFALAILKNPGDETIRLVLADYLADKFNFTHESSGLSKPGYWYVGGAVNRQVAALNWLPSDANASLVLSCLRPARIPRCSWCHNKPPYADSQMLRQGDGELFPSSQWLCSYPCFWTKHW